MDGYQHAKPTETVTKREVSKAMSIIHFIHCFQKHQEVFNNLRVKQTSESSQQQAVLLGYKNILVQKVFPLGQECAKSCTDTKSLHYSVLIHNQ